MWQQGVTTYHGPFKNSDKYEYCIPSVVVVVVVVVLVTVSFFLLRYVWTKRDKTDVPERFIVNHDYTHKSTEPRPIVYLNNAGQARLSPRVEVREILLGFPTTKYEIIGNQNDSTSAFSSTLF